MKNDSVEMVEDLLEMVEDLLDLGINISDLQGVLDTKTMTDALRGLHESTSSTEPPYC